MFKKINVPTCDPISLRFETNENRKKFEKLLMRGAPGGTHEGDGVTHEEGPSSREGALLMSGFPGLILLVDTVANWRHC